MKTKMDCCLPVKMIILLFITGFLSVGTLSQKLVVTNAPSYVTFQEQEKPLQASDVPNVISHTLGVSTSSEPRWEGLLHGSLFKRPKANVLVTLVTSENTPALNIKSKAEFPVNLDIPGVDIRSLMSSVEQNFFDKNPLVLDAGLESGIFDIQSEFDVFSKLPNTLRRMSDRLLDADSIAAKHDTGSLNKSMNTDLSLMGELQMIQDVIQTLQTDKKMLTKKTPDLFSFTISSLPEVEKKHGKTSSQVTDAQNLIQNFINQMTDQFSDVYKDNVVVEVLTVTPPKGHIRKIRSVEADPKKNVTNHRFALDYTADYPVFFNIILWLMIFMAIAFYAVCYAIWNMDPGRDSIIYRMTTTRLKKE